MQIPRREFFRGAAAGAAGLTAASYSRILGANERIQIGIIGHGIRGRYLITVFPKVPNVSVSAVCEIYGDRLDAACKAAPGSKPFSHYKKMLETKDLDGVYIACPDHWHMPMAIDAMDAGKDVYVEKPLALTIDEGMKIVRTARVKSRICQVGMHRRSGPQYIEAKRDYIDTGKLGKVMVFRSWWYRNPAHLLKAPPALKVKPDNLNWAEYLGRVKWREWDPQQYWNFRGYLDFGGGQVTDLFTHWIDILHMFTGNNIPSSAVAAGGVYSHPDGRTSPDTIHLGLEYPGGIEASFDAALAVGDPGSGAEWLGTNGKLVMSAKHSEFHPFDKSTPPVIKRYEVDATGAHVANFIDCMRTRKLPNADVLIGHQAAQAAHLGNLAYIHGRRILFDVAREEIIT